MNSNSKTLAQRGLDDLIQGAQNWRLCHLMGTGEIRRRYARSRLGQFWLTLSTLLMIIAMGLVWSVLWKVNTADLLPYLAVSLILWTFISGSLTEAATVFSAAGPMFLNQGMSFSTAVYALIHKNLIILLHNLPIIVLVFLFYSQGIGWESLWAIPGLALMIISVTWMSYLIGIICLRFRDLIQVVQNLLTILFFTTPILWKAEQIPSDKTHLILVNPFAVMISVVRDPLLAHVPPLSTWLVALGISFIGLLIALPLIGSSQRRLIYWI